MSVIQFNIAVEDTLSEAVARKIIQSTRSQDAEIGYCYYKGGYGYLRKNMHSFNKASRVKPFLVLADLQAQCAPIQIGLWLSVPMNPNLLFRIAVREVESWLLADRQGIASFLYVSATLVPIVVDAITDPKQCLVKLAKRSSRRGIRESIAPKHGTTAKVGPDYNGQLVCFVEKHWDITAAMKNSSSLARAVKAVANFEPAYHGQDERL